MRRELVADQEGGESGDFREQRLCDGESTQRGEMEQPDEQGRSRRVVVRGLAPRYHGGHLISSRNTTRWSDNCSEAVCRSVQPRCR